MRDSVPGDTTPPPPPPPPPGHAARLDAVPTWQQVAVGDSGVVRAIVRDSAGREMQVSGITFTLRDTTIVQNISVGLAFRTFRARHVGRTLYDVRYNTLADTAVVVVVADSTLPPPPPPPPPAPVARIVVTPQSQQLEVGDSGAVTATLFDSGGTAVRGDVGWDLGATSSVLRFLSWASSPVNFVAVGPGRARLIARYQALADTAVVIVVQSPSPPPDPVTRIIVSPKSQERVVGDSGVVNATLRDGAGRDVWPGEITWESSDTSTVLHVRSVGSSWIVFDALRSGIARLIAHHRDLADTAVVTVR